MRYATAFNALLFSGLVLITSAFALSRAHNFQPAPEQTADLLHGKLAHAFESHYDEVFPVKNLGVNLWAAIDFVLFHEGRPGVVLGRQGWLYTDEEFKLENDPREQVERNLALVGWIHRELAARGIALLVTVVPEKARVYPEYLDRRQPPELHRALYAEIQTALRSDGIASAELLAPLNEGKARQPTYLRTDTHWTPFGAQLAAAAIADRVQSMHLGVAASEFRTASEGEQTHRGDLFNFLPLDPYFGWLLPAPDEVAKLRTEADGGGAADLLGSPAGADVALVGTSYSANPLWNFAGALKQALHADVMNYAKDGGGPFAPMLAYLQSDDLRTAPPKLVIWELPERYLPMRQSLDAFHLPPAAFAARAAPQGMPLAATR